MRINRYIAAATGLSRRSADEAIASQRVKLNGLIAELGARVNAGDSVSLDDQTLQPADSQTIMLHKPAGYITSRRQQGDSPTIYRLLPPELHRLKPVGRLDRDSSGLLLLTDDGQLAQHLQHPSKGKWKTYHVRLNKPLSSEDCCQLEEGVALDDGPSRLRLQGTGLKVVVQLQEGRNRQIRRSFAALGYQVVGLHRSQFGPYRLGKLGEGEWRNLKPIEDEHESAA